MKLLILCAFPASLWAQAGSGSAKTLGSCSPAVTGNDNHITVTCSGLSKEKADDLVRLMNNILSRQLDPKKVYGQLDQIYGTVNDMNNTLTTALNPLAGASPTAISLVEESQALVRSCSNFTRDWMLAISKRQTEAMSAYSSQQGQAPPPENVDWHEITVQVDRKWSAQYQKLLAPRVAEMVSKVIARLPAAALEHVPRHMRVVDASAVKFQSDFYSRTGVLTILLDLYTDTEQVPNPDQNLLQGLRELRKECIKFGQDWFAEYNKSAGQPQSHSRPQLGTLDAKNSVDAEYSTQFDKGLRPQIQKWQARIAQEVPSLQNLKALRSVTTNLDMSQLCSDVMYIGNDYRSKLIADLQKRRDHK